jgi:soluble lytic murein transglycosylase-like protein
MALLRHWTRSWPDSRLVKRIVQFAPAWVVLIGSAWACAADLAILRNGNSIRHDRRQVVGAITRLYLSNTSSGYIEIPTEQILRFEHDDGPAPMAAQSADATALVKEHATAPANSGVKFAPLSASALNELVNGAGERNQIDPAFINSVIKAESGFNSRAVSKKGAQGLMQLMPQTAGELGVQNPFDPHANVEGGSKYLRELLQKYDFDVVKALAAYNAGPKRVDRYRGVPPFYETQAYIARIIRDYNRQKLAENPALAKKPARKSSATKPRVERQQRASRLRSLPPE